MSSNKPNYQRMLNLIDEVFAKRNDPDQIQVTQQEMIKLNQIHTSCLTEMANEKGPLIWVLMIPTTIAIMQDFLNDKITEKELLNNTPINTSYQAIYLCSATTLPEARNQGETKQLCLNAIKEILKSNPIENLFVWPFTKAGEALATTIANATSLKLLIK
jgi:hypothetical protein